MTVMPGTYFAKNKRIIGDKIAYEYDLVLDGTVIETVKTRAEAQRWWKRTMADLKRMEISMLREAKARKYALHI
jgi:hypothetical protein